MARILVVDDEMDVRDYLCSLLQEENFEPHGYDRGESILSVIKDFKPDLILLDYKLPGMSGVDVVKEVRACPELNKLPIIMVTGLDGEEQKVAALEMGADDYVVKPFLPKELAARIRAVLRRASEVSSTQVENLEMGKLTVNLRSHQVFLGNNEVYLTLTEFRILSELLRLQGQVISRDQLRRTALGNLNVTDRTIDVHMASLRKKLSTFSDAIQTVRGVGYRLAPLEDSGKTA